MNKWGWSDSPQLGGKTPKKRNYGSKKCIYRACSYLPQTTCTKTLWSRDADGSHNSYELLCKNKSGRHKLCIYNSVYSFPSWCIAYLPTLCCLEWNIYKEIDSSQPKCCTTTLLQHCWTLSNQRSSKKKRNVVSVRQRGKNHPHSPITSSMLSRPSCFDRLTKTVCQSPSLRGVPDVNTALPPPKSYWKTKCPFFNSRDRKSRLKSLM